MRKRKWFKKISDPRCDIDYLLEIIRVADEELINCVDTNGQTALMMALLAHQDDLVISALFEKGASINASGSDGMTPMHHAALLGESEIIQLLLKKGAVVDSKNSKGETALMMAIQAHQDDLVISALLEKGASVTASDSDGMTPMHHAALLGESEVIQMLLKKGAVVDSKNSKGETALMLAAAENSDLYSVIILLEAGADVSLITNSGSSVAMYATLNNNPFVLKTVKEYGADINFVNDYGQSCLHWAIRKDFDISRIKELLHLSLTNKTKGKEKEDSEAIEYKEYITKIPSALILASIFATNPEVITVLVDAGADIEERDSFFGWTPLMLAARSNKNPEVIRKLVALGSDINIKDADGHSSLSIVAKYGTETTEIIKILAEAGAALDSTDNEGDTPLFIAAKNYYNHDIARGTKRRRRPRRGDRDYVMWMWRNRLDPFDGLFIMQNERTDHRLSTINKKEKIHFKNELEKISKTPRIFAVNNNKHLEFMNILIHCGANINIKDASGLTPLLYAVIKRKKVSFQEGKSVFGQIGKIGVAQMLIREGADLEIEWNGNNVLHHAIVKEDPEIVKLLLEAKASIATDIRRAKKCLIGGVFGDEESGCTINFNYDDRDVNDSGYTTSYNYDDRDVDEYLKGAPLISLAAFNNHDKEIISLLLSAGVDVNEIDYNFGKTALMWACEDIYGDRHHKENMIKELIAQGAKINATDYRGWTALMYAVITNGNPDLVKQLVKAGADINKICDDGVTVVDVAKKLKNDELIHIFEQADKLKINIDAEEDKFRICGTRRKLPDIDDWSGIDLDDWCLDLNLRDELDELDEIEILGY